MTLQAIFVIVPSFVCIALYIGIAAILYRDKKSNKSSSGVTRYTFITISILLALFYLSYWPSTFLRDLPRLFNKDLSLPRKLTISMSVFYYLNGITDPIVYGFRSKYLFTRLKKRAVWFSGSSQSTDVRISKSGSAKLTNTPSYCNTCRSPKSLNKTSSIAMTTMSSTA